MFKRTTRNNEHNNNDNDNNNDNPDNTDNNDGNDNDAEGLGSRSEIFVGRPANRASLLGFQIAQNICLNEKFMFLEFSVLHRV